MIRVGGEEPEEKCPARSGNGYDSAMPTVAVDWGGTRGNSLEK
jgi:hypothetical protein